MKEKVIKSKEEVVITKKIKKLVGEIVSDKMDKTVVVKITEKLAHPKYGKIYQKSRKIQAHDEKNEYKIGQKVEIAETRPYSKNKSWQVTKVVSTKQVPTEIIEDSNLDANIDGSAK